MLSTLHSCSNLGVKTDLELFTLPPTQFSHEGEEFIEYHPSALKAQDNDSIEFFIPNTGEHYLDPSSIFLEIRARIVRSNGVATVELPAAQAQWNVGDAEEQPDKVYPCDNFVNSMFRFCDVYLNGKLITSHELYAYRSYLDLITQANPAMRHRLWPLMFEQDEPNQVLDLVSKHGITNRYKATKASRVFDMETPLFTDLAQQGMLLLPGVNVRIVFRQNPENFRLITTDAENREYKLDIQQFKIRARYVKISDSVRLAQEEALKLKPALYLLRGVETRIRSLPERSADILLENICPQRVPSKITVFFVLTESFYGAYKKNPLKLENLNIRKSSLFVGSHERREVFDFDRDLYATAFVNLCRALDNPHAVFKKDQYKHNNFMLHYILTPDCSTENLSPIRNENVRLQIELEEPLQHSYTCIIVTETPRILEIDQARNVELK